MQELIDDQDYETALSQLLPLQSVIESSELKYQAQYHFLAGKIYGYQNHCQGQNLSQLHTNIEEDQIRQQTIW